MKRTDKKSHCPINFGLEAFGDPWSLLILRDIVYLGKRTYGEFFESEERIASAVLATRLAELLERGILAKERDREDRRRELYRLTEKGIALVPVLLEIANWSAQFDVNTTAPPEWIAAVNADRPGMVMLIQATLREGGSIFVGANSVVAKLAEMRS